MNHKELRIRDSNEADNYQVSIINNVNILLKELNLFSEKNRLF